MIEVQFSFDDPDAGRRSVKLGPGRYVIGRHSACDITIADPRLSREHAELEIDDRSVRINDLGSSNGTELNGFALTGSAMVNDGDRLSFGGSEAGIAIDLGSDEPGDPGPTDAPTSPPLSEPAAPVQDPSASDGASMLPLFIGAPVAALLLLAVIGGYIFFVRGTPGVRSNRTDIDLPADTPDPDRDPTPRPVNSPRANATPFAANIDGNVGSTSVTQDGAEAAVEKNATAFLKKAARNDPRAFITGEQAKLAAAKVKALASSSGTAASLAAVRRSAGEFRSIASANGIKPDMLAAAALAKLNGAQGDVVATARSMAPVLNKLAIQVGNELGDDCLLMMAAYDQAAAGDTMRMRNMLQDLSTRESVSVREIRTIWYLRRVGKITEPQFELALRFLAVGAIMQDPRAFGISSEPAAF